MPDPIKPTAADTAQADRFCNPVDQPILHRLLVKAFALHARQAREQALEEERARIVAYLEADDGRHLVRVLARNIRKGEHLKEQRHEA